MHADASSPPATPGTPSRRIAHVDMDAFYASVEIRDDPSLAGKPVVVGGAAGQRGVVAAASYAARQFGIRSAMPMAQAVRRCPDLVRLPGDPAKYAEVSRQVFAVLETFSPTLETLSLDEAFLDVSGTERHFGPDAVLGRRIKDAIKEAVALTASVGLAPCKFAAKLASDHGKPDGLVVVTAQDLVAFLEPLPIERLWGVGQKTAPRLHALGIRTMGDLAARDPAWVRAQLGDNGLHLQQLARGQDDREVVPDAAARSISSEMTFATDLDDRERLRGLLADQAQRVGARLRRAGLAGRTVTLKLRDDTFDTRTRQKTLGAVTDDGEAIYRAACALLDADPLARPLRLIGVGASGLVERTAGPLSLFDAVAEPAVEASAAFQKALDGVESRFGPGKLRRGQSLLADEVRDTGTDLGKRA
jgi:DNA polymerase-4